MNKIVYPFLVSLLLCFVSCESGEPPVLGTIEVDPITAKTVTCNVEVVAGEIVECGFYYGTSKNNVSKGKSDKVVGTCDMSTIHGEIVGLTPNKEYYIMAYGMNDLGKGETEVVKVKTLALIPGEDDNEYPDTGL